MSDLKEFANYKKTFIQGNYRSCFKRPLLGSKDWNDNAEPSEEHFDMDEVKKSEMLPLRNLLDIPGLEQRGVFTRTIYYLYVVTTRAALSYPGVKEITKSVLGNQNVFKTIRKNVARKLKEQSEDEKADDEKEQEQEKELTVEFTKQAANILQEMVATVTSKCLRFCGWLFMTLLRRLCSSVSVHKGQMKVIEKILKADKPVIFVPLHYSHFDYILLSLLMYHSELRAPFVASGNNLDLPIFSYVMKRVGGFFIRRKIDTGKDKDTIYRAVLHSYVTELLKQNQVLEVFIEGTRSRGGFPNQPKTGILSMAVEAIESRSIDDALVVPLCISYEKLIDGHFQNELMGQEKKPESLGGAFRTSVKLLTGYYGHIRINFGVPKSLKDTLHNIKSSPNSGLQEMESLWMQKIQASCQLASGGGAGSPTKITTARRGGGGSRHSDQLVNGSIFSRSSHHRRNSAVVNPKRMLVNLLAEHLVYRSLMSKVYMSTNILAFLLTHRYRSGVNFSVLTIAFEELVKELLNRKWDVGFSGNFTDVVEHALKILGKDLVKIEYYTNVTAPHTNQGATDDDGQLLLKGGGGEGGACGEIESEMVKIERCGDDDENEFVERLILPNLQTPHVFELAYYSNALAPVFAMESLAALAIGAVLDCRFSTIELEFLMSASHSQTIRSDQLPQSMTKEFKRNDLITLTLELTDILQFDLILCDIADDLETCVVSAVDRLVADNCIHGNTRPVQKGFAAMCEEYTFADENEQQNNQGEEWLMVNFNAIHNLIAKQSIIAPLVEGYVSTMMEIPCMLDGPVAERDFKVRALNFALKRIEDNVAIRPESASSEIIKQAIHAFEHNDIVERCGEENKSLQLTKQCDSYEAIAEYVSFISKYRM